VAAEQEGDLALLPLSNAWKFSGDPEDKGALRPTPTGDDEHDKYGPEISA